MNRIKVALYCGAVIGAMAAAAYLLLRHAG